MPAVTKHPQKVIKTAVAAYRKTRSLVKASEAVRARHGVAVSERAISHWVSAKRLGREPSTAAPRAELLAELAGLIKEHGPDISNDRYCRSVKQPAAWKGHFSNWIAFRGAALHLVPDDIKAGPERVFAALKAKPLTLKELAEQLSVTEKGAQRAVERASAHGYNIHLRGDYYHVENIPGPRRHDPALHEFVSDASGVFRFGITTDNHIGSKYARLDALNNLYDLFAQQGITRVYNCGNWIDGEARFNKHDLEPWAHGMDNQLRGFAEHFPRRPGIHTYYVSGDDHEGWYDGVDIGLRAQQTAREMGRDDLHYLGFMEAFIRLRHKKTGKGSVMGVVHPGGGSAYAISYSPQKIVESYQGGEKPAVVLLGHYHKMDVFNYRNVWIIQAGCTQDQTPFMRKKRIEAHVGGVVVELTMDERGAVTRCKTEQIRYFDRGYYNFQFDRAGPLKRIPLGA